MVGGAISGYCATGRRKKATPPRITKIIETTEAKIGRSIKKCEMRMSRNAGYLAACSWFGVLLLWPHFLSRTSLHQTADHDAVVRADTFLDDPQAIFRELSE